MLAAAVAIGLDAPLAAYAGAIVASTAVVTTRPAQAALVPALVHEAGQLTAANAITGWIESAGLVVSSAATGVLLATAGAGWVFAVFGALGLLAVVLAASVRGVPAMAVEDDGGPGGPAEALAGFRLLIRQRKPRLLVTLLTVQWVVLGALDILLIVLAIDVLQRGDAWVGYLNTAFGLGGVVAGVAGLTLVGRHRLAIPILGGAALLGGALALTAVLTSAPAALVLLAVAGGGQVVLNVATRTLLQRVVPAEVVGRVFGVAEGLAMVGLAVGAALVPLLVAVGGTVAAIAGTAVLAPLVALVGLRALLALDRTAHVPIVEIALLRSLPLFRVLPAPALEGLARALERVELAGGDVLITEGDEGDRFYAVAAGRLEVTMGGKPIATLTRGQGAGEIALLHSVPRTATVTATTPAVVFSLAREPFLAAVTGHAATERTAAAVARERLDELDRHRPRSGD
jgi:hypothetical protein